MREALTNLSAVLELAVYLIASTGIDIKQGESLRAVLRRLGRMPNVSKQYLEQVRLFLENTPSGQQITVFRTSIGSGYASPMNAVCFLDGDAAFILYRGTPDGGWVQNPISYGADICSANAADCVSSRIQADGLDFFNACVAELATVGFTGRFVVGGHSQGGNVAEYVTVISGRTAQIDLCVSLDGPNHSTELYQCIITQYGQAYLKEQAGKIIAVNGHNDFVNMQGQVDFAYPDNTFYLKTDDAWADENGHSTFPGWHDALYMMDRINGGLLPYDAAQGPVGKLMTRIVAVINTLSQEVQEDCSMAIMGLLELILGSKNWDDLKATGLDAGSILGLLICEEFVGLVAKGLPAIFIKVIRKPALLIRALWELLPKRVRKPVAAFYHAAPAIFILIALPIFAVLAIIFIILSTVVVGLYWIADLMITLFQRLTTRSHGTVS